jgi:hypothetical protein
MTCLSIRAGGWGQNSIRGDVHLHAEEGRGEWERLLSLHPTP